MKIAWTASAAYYKWLYSPFKEKPRFSGQPAITSDMCSPVKINELVLVVSTHSNV